MLIMKWFGSSLFIVRVLICVSLGVWVDCSWVVVKAQGCWFQSPTKSIKKGKSINNEAFNAYLQ